MSLQHAEDPIRRRDLITATLDSCFDLIWSHQQCVANFSMQENDLITKEMISQIKQSKWLNCH